MEINTAVLLVTFGFLALYFAIDRTASVLREKSRNEADVSKHSLDAQSLKDMGDKLVAAMAGIHGGAAGEAVRMMGNVIDPEEWRPANGPVRQQRDNGRGPASAGFPQQHRAAETASH